MFIKEISYTDGTKYTIGITESKNHLSCYILKKIFIGYRKIHSHKSLKMMTPDYDYITLCTICEYERKLKDRDSLIKWSLN